MDSYSVIESTLKEILKVIVPPREDWVTRLKVIDELRNVVQSMESLRGATVEPFGSFVSNLFIRGGDLDISIELSNGSHISNSAKKRQRNLLAELLGVMRRRGGWYKLQFIGNAQVPILKSVSAFGSISCDISIDNLKGQMKSKFLFWVTEIDGRFRDMVLLVKEWAKAHKINNPKAGSLNSYSLSLLVIFHFQTCVPAILPPLRILYPGNMVDELTGVRADSEQRITEVCSTNIARFKSDKSRPVNRSSLSELFVSFIAKFCDIHLKAEDLGICVFNGQWEDINSNTRWLPKNKALFIEDPFEQPANTARTVSDKKLMEISEAFQATHLTLISSNLTRNSLLVALARPNIFPSILNGQAGYPSYNGGGHYATTQHPQLQGAGISSQMQQQQHFWPHNSVPQMQHQNWTGNAPYQMQHQNWTGNAPHFQPQHQYRHPRHPGPRNQLQSQNKRPTSSQAQPQRQNTRNVRGSSPQVRPQNPNRRPESRPENLSTQRPMLQNPSQAQRMWRPRPSNPNSGPDVF